MDEDVLCQLPADAHGRVLDRLAALEQVISPEAVRQAVQACPVPYRERACVLTREVMLWVVLAMGLFTHLPIRQVFKAARRLRRDEPTPDRSSLCLARQRLGIAPVRHLFEHTVRLLATPQTPGAFYKGHRLMALDGVVWSVPDSDANCHAFGRPVGGRGEGAFPQIRKLSLIEVGTHVELAFVLKGVREPQNGEKSMASALFRHLQPDMLLVWDRNFFSYSLWQGVRATGAHLLARVSSRLVLRPVQNLTDGSYLAYLYPDAADRTKKRKGILVRVIRYTLNDPQRVGYGQEHVLLTSLLDAERYPAQELILLYHERWEIELVYDEQKTHQSPRRATKTAHLRSETPSGVIQEMYALSLAHYVVRALMVDAAQQEQLDPDRLSLLGCLQILQCRLPECPSDNTATLQQWYEAFRWELSQERIEPRRNRVNPRVVKVKMSKFKKKRPEHRGLRPLQHTFAETVVMLI